ncbi:MAG: tRNA (adenosine(37)-N6)-threonylcarbamoyltransferase complex ATPase subunit type 1 TsaE [Bacilli bacterium]|nr:tRNA (adenosine(37)-N6)-threonylcarbamoyltransferase complex ATPase subunit type 1 TsaE [Erysipelotrichaceae bacterium]MDY4819882.1 tRNA (adenosine(37)-N6)-threonylcarbamoyltransferase complex ATPase subunit type 1 TsaE [Bacilli bacterium]MDY5669758.1 tRNA (adenosine(37)-N6)-threonylcarbamoyltransferase complex ATPase subunit type 1 TsaE [Bacilli bacterium]
MEKIEIYSHSLDETNKLAKILANNLKSESIILLSGDLGAGKTTLVGGILNELGYKDHVVSPTFNILKCYFEVTPNVFHIDAYRLEDQNHDIGLEEFIEGEGICFIEWPKFIEELIPNRNLKINIYRIDDNSRKFEIIDETDSYLDVLKAIKEAK